MEYSLAINDSSYFSAADCRLIPGYKIQAICLNGILDYYTAQANYSELL